MIHGPLTKWEIYNLARSAEHARIERAAFAAFLEACPRFALEVEEWPQPDDQFPDIAVRLKGGRTLDFELGEWLHQAQMSAAKKRESLEAELLGALDPLGANTTANVRFVLLEPQESAPRFQKEDAESFRQELRKLIATVDASYSSEKSWQARERYSQRDLRHYPTLGKYLRTVLFDWAKVGGEAKEPFRGDWIDATPTGSAYNPNTALEALQGIIEEKLAKYGHRLPAGSRLLIHYGKGWIYNTPFRGTSIRSLADVARWAAEQLAERSVPFERIYLADVFEGDPKPQAFQIYPGFVPGGEVVV